MAPARQTHNAMTRSNARHTISTEGRLHTLVVYFRKRSGENRRMVCRYFGAGSRRAYLMTVQDLEKGALRSVNLDTVRAIKVLRRPDRQPVSRQH